jgi:two-component system, OmpR family, sensor kinase
MRRRLSLRARLVLGVVVLASIGLIAADVATYGYLRSFLLHRVDTSLGTEHTAFDGGPPGRGGPEHRPNTGCGAGLPAGDYVEIRTLSGKIVCSHQGTFFNEKPTESPPALPTKLSLPPAADANPERARFFTVSAQSGSGRYRVRAAVERGSGQVLLLATPLTSVDSTLNRLLVIEVLVTAAVLAAIAALGLWAVRLGLRPLAAIGRTAAAIADGDLSQRVERAEDRTEVGRLGIALNAMLGQIERAFKAQAASEQRLRRFVADASHELRTPLAAVRAYAELFTRGADRRPDDLARAMSGITREAERMSLLVDDLLLLARLDEGRPLDREPVALEQVLGEAVETAGTVDPDRPIQFVADSAVVLGDRDRLRQIVDNLLGNVRAHTPPRTPVRVSLESRNGSAVIAVADSGPGMSAEQIERAFERFYRADASRSRASGGVGLGLSIVAAVAEAHGGTVAVRSEEGVGSTFEITLPVLQTT